VIAALKAIAAVIGVVATLLGVIFTVLPSLKPEEPAAVKGAKLDALSADEIITRRQYFQRAQLPITGLTANELKTRGVFVTFRLTIEGFKGKKLPLRWELINATTGDEVGQAASTIFKPLASRDSASWQEWIPLPVNARKYVIFVRLYDPSGTVPLAAERSEPIASTRGRPPG
jgi:hypothetical protein